jgi:DNA-binding NarL/FixJ family response regulator
MRSSNEERAHRDRDDRGSARRIVVGGAKALRAVPPNSQAHHGRPIRILIAADHPVVREGLRALFATQPDMTVVGTANDGEEALRMARELAPDVTLLDLCMPGRSGVDVIREMKETNSSSRTILLTAEVDKTDVSQLLQLGVRGVVLKDSPIDLVFKSIRKVHDGELWVDRETMVTVVEKLAASSDAERDAAKRACGLTPREREVVQHVIEGETNKAIAERMRVGADTVKHHLTSIFDKTGVSNRLELALFALHHRLVQR